MKPARVLGFNIMVAARKANISDAELGQLIGCSENDVKRIYAGRLYMSFQQLATIANHTNTNVSTLLTNQEDYEKQDQKTQASHPVPPPFQGVTDRIFRQHPASMRRQVYFIMG